MHAKTYSEVKSQDFRDSVIMIPHKKTFFTLYVTLYVLYFPMLWSKCCSNCIIILLMLTQALHVLNINYIMFCHSAFLKIISLYEWHFFYTKRKRRSVRQNRKKN